MRGQRFSLLAFVVLAFAWTWCADAQQQPAMDVRPIDLETALRLAGVSNPELRLARERVLEAVALRQLAAAQFLPSINVGTNLNHHQGPLQQSNGTILNVNRDAMYLGLGAGAIGAGTVNIPGVVWGGNLADTWYNNLVARQVVRQRGFESDAVRNDVLLRVSAAYLDLLRAAGRLSAARQTNDDAKEVARVTKDFADKGKGRQSDADRAATEFSNRKVEVIQAEADLQIASARLCRLLNLDPSVRLVPMETHVVPGALVPNPIPLQELLAIALWQRPEMQERKAAIRAAFLELRNKKLLPFSPNVLVGFSSGTFGGGSNIIAQTGAQPRFGSFNGREDFDAVMYWSLRNLGVGNVAMIRYSQSQLRQNELREIETLDRVRSEVATSQARMLARFDQIEFYEKAMQSSQSAFKQDFTRIKSGEGLPIELINSLQLLGRSRYSYLDTIVDYNRAQFELYVAIGQPPADTLARPVPFQLGPPIPK
jgi:outer membrane protein TolC